MTDQNDDIPSLAWIERTQSWLLYETANTDNCDRYALCGANGLCNIQSSPVCECLDGFVPKVPTDWAVTVCVNIFKPRVPRKLINLLTRQNVLPCTQHKEASYTLQVILPYKEST